MKEFESIVRVIIENHESQSNIVIIQREEIGVKK